MRTGRFRQSRLRLQALRVVAGDETPASPGAARGAGGLRSAASGRAHLAQQFLDDGVEAIDFGRQAAGGFVDGAGAARGRRWPG